MIYFLFLFTGHDPPLTPIILQRHSALHTGCGRAPHRNRNDSTLWTCNPLSLPLFSYPSPSSPSLPLPRLLFLPPPLLLSLPSYSTPIPSPSPSLSTPRHSLILPSYSLPLLLTPFALPFYYLPHLLLFPPPPPPIPFPVSYFLPSPPIPFPVSYSLHSYSLSPSLFSSYDLFPSPSLQFLPLSSPLPSPPRFFAFVLVLGIWSSLKGVWGGGGGGERSRGGLSVFFSISWGGGRARRGGDGRGEADRGWGAP